MEAIRKTVSLNEAQRTITLSIPENFGSKVRVIILPEFKGEDEPDYFEIVGSDGTEYKMPNWTEEEFKMMGHMDSLKDDDTRAEDIFHV